MMNMFRNTYARCKNMKQRSMLLVQLIIAITVLVTAGCGGSGGSDGGAETSQIALQRTGRYLYQDNCEICHSLGTVDTTSAFYASNLVGKGHMISSDMSAYGGSYALMSQFGPGGHVFTSDEVAALQAYINSI